MADAWTPEQFGSIRASGEAADGLVRVEVDGAGQVVDVTVDDRAMRLPAWELAAAVKESMQQAQATARAQAAELAGRLGTTLPSRDRLAAEVAEVSVSAEQRLNEFSAALYDLSRRAGSQW